MGIITSELITTNNIATDNGREKHLTVFHIASRSSFYSVVCSSPGLSYLPKPDVGIALHEPFQIFWKRIFLWICASNKMGNNQTDLQWL